MDDEIHWDFDRDFERAVEQEPRHARPPRLSSRPPLDARGTLKVAITYDPPPAPSLRIPGRDARLAKQAHDAELFDTVEEKRGDK